MSKIYAPYLKKTKSDNLAAELAREARDLEAQERARKCKEVYDESDTEEDSGTEDKVDPAKPPPTAKSNSKPNGTTTTCASERAPLQPQPTLKSNQKPNGTTPSASTIVPTNLQPIPQSNPKRDGTNTIHKALGLASKALAHCTSNITHGGKASSQHQESASKVTEDKAGEETEITPVLLTD